VISDAIGSGAGKHVVRAQFDTHVTVWRDGVPGNSQAVSLSTGTSMLRFGARATTTAAEFAKVALSAILITKPLTDRQAATLSSWLARRIG
jgi:hypothetical protein